MVWCWMHMLNWFLPDCLEKTEAFTESNARPTQPHVGTMAILRMRLIPIPGYGTKQKRLE